MGLNSKGEWEGVILKQARERFRVEGVEGIEEPKNETASRVSKKMRCCVDATAVYAGSGVKLRK